VDLLSLFSHSKSNQEYSSQWHLTQ